MCFLFQRCSHDQKVKITALLVLSFLSAETAGMEAYHIEEALSTVCLKGTVSRGSSRATG